MSPAEYVYNMVIDIHYILNIDTMLMRYEDFSKLVKIYSASNL